jgi:hypothetical protein
MKPAVHGTSIIRTPGTIDFSNGRSRINQSNRDKGEQYENAAHHVALLIANPCAFDRLSNVFIPKTIGYAASAGPEKSPIAVEYFCEPRDWGRDRTLWMQGIFRCRRTSWSWKSSVEQCWFPAKK